MRMCVQGRNVILDQTYGAPRITKDGVSVAKEIEFKDRSINLGAQLVRSGKTRNTKLKFRDEVKLQTRANEKASLTFFSHFCLHALLLLLQTTAESGFSRK
jgi:hypothetical protein